MTHPLDLTPIQNRLDRLREEAAKASTAGYLNITPGLSRARTQFQVHAADDIEHLLEEIHRLRAEHQEHPNTRTIHTAEELQQLPEGTVIIGHNGWVWENMSGLWHTTGSLPPMDHGAHIFTFPARVIYMPEEGDQQ